MTIPKSTPRFMHGAGLLACLLTLYATAQVTELAPPSGWGEMDRRAFAAEALVLAAHEMPMPTLVRLLGGIKAAGMTPGPETRIGQLLELARTGQGERPMPGVSMIEVRQDGAGVRDWLPVSSYSSFAREGK